MPLRVHASAATSSSSTLSPAVSSAVELLKQTSADSRVPPQAVFAALRTLEAAKLQVRECVRALAGYNWRRWQRSEGQHVRLAPF